MGENIGKPISLATYFAGQGMVDGAPILSFIENGVHIPFDIKRVFWLDLFQKEHGFHAHRTCQQVMFCIRGEIELHIALLNKDETSVAWEVSTTIKDGAAGVLIEPYMYIRYKSFPPNNEWSTALVFASELYDPDDYIRMLK